MGCTRKNWWCLVYAWKNRWWAHISFWTKKTGELTEKSENVPHIIEWAKQLPNGTILLGEIFVPGGHSNDVTKIMGCTATNAIKRQTQTEEFGGLIHYYVFDCIRYNNIDLISIGFFDRWQYLKKFEYSPQVHLSIIYDSDFESILNNIFIMGGEGMVFKRKDSVYEPDKRPMTCFKMKEHVDSVDLICMELLDPVWEYTGKEIENWPYWMERGECTSDNTFDWIPCGENYYKDSLSNPHIFKPVTKPAYYGWKNAMRLGAYKDGKLIEVCRVASGLSDYLREDMAINPEKYLNQVVQVSCMSLNKKDKTIRHPVFETMRYDKDIKDCQLEEIFS